MSFKEILLRAKTGEEPAVIALLEMYKPLLVKGAIVGGRFDEDLYQELCITLIRCIKLFRF
ncbi:MAG: helix-turn-helix domain-containing protein [Lachnospiraceae bacterium]|nr:helix-turn-helix domain-containing protein [Lachnospiraceae bacterium]